MEQVLFIYMIGIVPLLIICWLLIIFVIKPLKKGFYKIAELFK